MDRDSLELRSTVLADGTLRLHLEYPLFVKHQKQPVGRRKQPFVRGASNDPIEPFSPDPNRRRKAHRRHFVARSIEKDGLRRSSPNVRCVALCVYEPSGCALRRIRLGAMAIDHATVRSLKVAKNVSHSEQ